VREHNAKVIAKLQPVPPFKHQIFQIHGSNTIANTALATAALAFVSRSVACKVFFSGKFKFLDVSSHSGSADAYADTLLQSVAQLYQNGIIVLLYQRKQHSLLFWAKFSYLTSPMRQRFNCSICAIPL
jgi:hypothetical protein